MIVLLILIVFGAAAAVFGTQNTDGVTINLANYTFSNIPLYLVVLVSMFIGILLSWIISVINGVATSFTMLGKDREIAHSERNIADLKKRVHELEIENERLKTREAVSTPHRVVPSLH